MKKSIVRLIASLMALVMVVGVPVVVPMTASATDTVGVGATAPTIAPKGEATDIWDGTTKTDPTLDNAAEGYITIDSAAEFVYLRENAASVTANTIYKLTCNIDMADHGFPTTTGPSFAGVLDGDGYALLNVSVSGSWGTASGYMFDTISGTVQNLNVIGASASSTGDDASGALFAKTLTGKLLNINVSELTNNASNAGGLVCSANGATIDNCHILSGTVTCSSKQTAGGLVGVVSGPITATNCSNYATVSTGWYNTYAAPTIGGLIGKITASTATAFTFSNLVNYGDVIDKTEDIRVAAGGIIGKGPSTSGQTFNITFESCANYGNISAPNNCSGFIANFEVDSGSTLNFKNCVNAGTVSSTGPRSAGGFVAATGAALSFENSTNYGNVSGGGDWRIGVGGFAGACFPKEDVQTIFANCSNFGSVTSLTSKTDASHMARAGGFVGSAGCSSACSSGSACAYKQIYIHFYLYNCAQYGDVLADNTSADNIGVAGGVVGYLNLGWTNANPGVQFHTEGCYFEGIVTGGYAAGGLVGYMTPDEYTSAVSSRHINMFVKNSVIASTRTTDTASANRTGAFVAFTNKKFDNSDAKKISTFTVSDSIIHVTADQPLNFYAGEVTSVVEGTNYTAYTTAMSTNHAAQNTLNDYVFTAPTSVTGAATFTLTVVPIPWAQSKNAPTLLTTLGFSGATMSLGGTMTLNMKLDADALAGLDILYVTFIDADTNTGVDATIYDDGYYTVAYDKRAAEMAESMNMQLLIALTNGEQYRSTNILTYSPAKYLTNLYEDYTGEKKDDAKAAYVLDVVKNMLAYGAESEAKRDGVAFDATATAKAASAANIMLPTDFTYTNEHTPGVMTEDDKAAINNIAQTGASLTGSISITFKMENTAYNTLTVSSYQGTSTYYVNSDGYITFENVPPAKILETFQLVFSGEGVEDVTANFCVGDFLELRRQANMDNDAALAVATIRYMMAVREYALHLKAQAR